MIKKQAISLWEDVLAGGNGVKAIKRLKIKEEESKIFLEYTKPEMFVSEETNRKSLLEIRKLEQKAIQVLNIVNKKKSSNLMLNIMLGVYFLAIFPILSLIIYIKYFS